MDISITTISVANFFAVAPGRNSWGPRTLTDFEFIYMVSGASQYIKTGSPPRHVHEGQILLIRPGTEHVFSCPNPNTTISCIHFSTKGNSPPFDVEVLDASEDVEILDLFAKCAREIDAGMAQSAIILRMALSEILIRLHRLRETVSQSREPPKVREALHFLRTHYKQPITRDNIARKAGVSPQHLNHLFKKHCKQSPGEILRDMRIKTAKILLRNPAWNVSQVAHEVGYDDPLYFSRVFKKAVGISPKAYGEML